VAKKGIKVKDIARELGLTSRQLIDHCRAEGIHVQNSITKLNPELERTIRGWFARAASNGKTSKRQNVKTSKSRKPQKALLIF
jgi:phage antirepressor YoqD-like protein